MKDPILIWDFPDAPEELCALSNHGGDEDGLLVVPAGQECPWWIERLWDTHGLDPSEHKLPDGRTVIIWAHA